MVSFKEEKLLRILTIMCGIMSLEWMVSMISFPTTDWKALLELFTAISYLGGPIAINLLMYRLGYPSFMRYTYILLAFILPMTLLILGFMDNIIDHFINILKKEEHEISALNEEAAREQRTKAQNSLESIDRQEVSYKQMKKRVSVSMRKAKEAVEQMKEYNNHVKKRAAAVNNLSTLGNRYALKYLTLAINYKEAYIREPIAMALGNYKEQVAIDILENVSKNDPVQSVREKATESLNKIYVKT